MKKNIVLQDGIVVGNIEDKAKLKNPISKALVNGFDGALFELIESANPTSIHEVGCGEGRLTSRIYSKFNVPTRATDICKEIIANLQTNDTGINYIEKSVYELNPEEDFADTIICCEVLEHLEDPSKALEVIKSLKSRNYIFSVPREPVWRALNMCRGKYIKDLGNTPGHLNHWSGRGFIKFLNQQGFQVSALKRPFPWTMVLGCFC